MFICKFCGHEVKQGQAFCPNCHADVVENYETVCSVCGSKNVGGSRYCAKCGSVLQVMRKPVCLVCGAKNLPGAKYCVSCGAPLPIENETHSSEDMIDARKMKQRLDNMERDRLQAVEKEIEKEREKIADEREKALREIENSKVQAHEEYRKKLAEFDDYRCYLAELGVEDVELLKKASNALKDYSKYYADPYTQIDEDEIDTETYVCPACGTINPLTATACTNCGRNKARALLLLAKNKIKQSPPVKRKIRIIPVPEEDLKRGKTPTLDEFIGRSDEPEKEPVKKTEETVKQDAPSNFSGPPQAPYYYPYPPYAGYQGQAQYPQMPNAGYYVPSEPRQMPPIVQPVAFVPYVTQEQPLMQYLPADDTPKQNPVNNTPKPEGKPRKERKRK